MAVPVELELQDRLAGVVTFRMAGWLAASGAGLALLAFGGGAAAVLVAGVLLVLVGLAGAFWQPAGRPLLWWVLPVAAYRRRRRNEQRRHAEEASDSATPSPESAEGVTEVVAEGATDFDLLALTPGVGRRRAVAGLVLVMLVGLSGVGGWAWSRHTAGAAVAPPGPAAPAPLVSPSASAAPAPAGPFGTRPGPGEWVVPIDPQDLWWWVDCGC